MAKNSYKGSYIPRAVYAPQSADDSRGGGLLGLGFGPNINLGLGTALQELGQGVSGLISGGFSLLTPGEDGPGAAEFAGSLAKGVGSSIVGTAETVVPGDFMSDVTAALLGEEYRPEDFFSRASDRGILPALIEDLGNVALVGGAITAPVRGAATAAKLAGATDDAARLSALHASLKANPTIKAMQQPYRTAGRKVRSDVLKPALASKLSAAGVGDAPGTAAADEALPEPDPITPDPSAAGTDTLTDVDVEAQATAVPETRLARATEGLPDPITSAFAKAEEFLQGREAVRTSRQQTRLAEMERRIASRDPFIQSAVTAAREHLIDTAGEHGVTLDRIQASAMLGEAIQHRLTGTQVAIDEMRARGVSDDIIREAGVLENPIPEELRTPELEAAIQEAAEAQVSMKAKITERLLASRKGAEGLEPDDTMSPDPTGKQKAALLQAERLRSRADGLDGQAAREQAVVGKRAGAAEERLGTLDEEIAAIDDRIAGAEDTFDRTRTYAPGGRLADEGTPPPADKSRAQESVGKPKFPKEATESDYYRSGRRGAKALAEAERQFRRKRQLERTKVQVQQDLDDLTEILETGKTKAQITQEKLRGRADKLEKRVVDQLQRPSVARTPARWQPVYQAFQEIGKVAESHPELAAVLKDIPQTLGEVQRLAIEKGFDPTHVRQFTPAQVRRLVFGNMQLGLGRNVSEATASTRKKRSGALTRAQAVDRSIEAFLAASVEATLEARTNAVVDHVEKVVARTVEAGGQVPPGWVPWSPTKTFLLTGTEVAETTGKAVTTTPQPTLIVPETVVKALRREASDHGHPLFTAVNKVTQPWRTLVLTLSPAWYARNVVGNAMLAAAEGVSLKDWAAAWRSARNKDDIGAFADIPFVTTDSLAQEGIASRADDPNAPGDTLIGREGIGEAMAEAGRVRGAASYAHRRLLRVNQVVDEFARAAVYHKGRRLNMSPEDAWHHASEALVDYGNLSPFERKAVRAVIPFYSWQKGILKVTVNQALDHPARAGILMQLGQIQEEYVADMLGVDPEDVPDYYKHLGIGDKNLRSWNPFADPTEILSPEGITRSMNPFVELFVRKGLGAPEFFPESYRMGQFGQAEADLDVASEFGDLLTSSPAGRMIGGDTGAQRLFGLHDQDTEKLRSRILRTRQQVRGIPNPETASPTR